MNIFRGIGRWLLAVAVATMIGIWISASVLQATILNRDTTKRWLAESGIYDSFVSSYFKSQTPTGTFVTNDDINKAFTATFPAGYVKQQSETALDALYDWIDGKAKTVSYSLPVNEKRQEFVDNLVKQVEPRIAALPQCTTRISPNTKNPTCIPQGITAADFTANLIKLDDSDPLLKNPLTPQTITDAVRTSGSTLPDMPYLPMAAQLARQAAFILPVLILLAGAAYVLLNDDKIRGLGLIGRRAFFQGFIVVIAGAFLWVAGTNLDLTTAAQDSDAQQLAIISNILNPFVQNVLPDVGRAFALFGGITAAVGAAAWIAAFIIRRKYTKVTPFRPVSTPQTTPPAPQQPAALPTPQAPSQQAQNKPKPPVPPRIIQ